jgi:hypothetical protein
MYGFWSDRPFAEIDTLTPSADAWRGEELSLAGLPFDSDDYRAKNIIHEFTHAVQITVWGEPRDAAYPLWWFEGLPEFDGLSRTTAAAEGTAPAALIHRVRSQLPEPPVYSVIQIDEALSVDRGYTAGPLFAWFLADKFGEDIHNELLRAAPEEFWSRLLRLTRTGQHSSLYGKFVRWLAARSDLEKP